MSIFRTLSFGAASISAPGGEGTSVGTAVGTAIRMPTGGQTRVRFWNRKAVKKLKRAALGAATVLAVWAGAIVIAQGVIFVARAEAADMDGYHLKRVVVVMRHGIRPPTKAQPVEAGLTTEAWPGWDVPYGNLTAHGEQAITRLASLDRQTYTHVFTSKCPHVHAWADTDQRTLKTAQTYVDVVFPGCQIVVVRCP